MPDSQFTYVSYIRTSPEKLWLALTDPAMIARYRFGMQVESDWKVGSAWKMFADGHLMDSGTILESVPNERLALGWVSEWSREFKAEGTSRCVFDLAPAPPSVKLTLTHTIPRPDSGFIAAVADGWPMVLSNLKSLLETGEVALVFHRRHQE